MQLMIEISGLSDISEMQHKIANEINKDGIDNKKEVEDRDI